MSLPRMRGIKEAIEEIRKADAGTALTEHCLRKLIKTRQIPCVYAGNKALINMDILEKYLCKGGGTGCTKDNVLQIGQTRLSI